MRNLFKILCLLFVPLCLSAAFNVCFAQHKKVKAHRSVRDSLRREVLKRDSLLRTFKHSDNSLNVLLQKIEYYNSSYSQDFSDFSQGYDTLDVNQNLPLTEKRLTVIGKLIQNDHSGSIGYLFTIRDILGHFKDDLDSWQKELEDGNTRLYKILTDAQELKADTAMHSVPSDSSLRAKYLPQILYIQKKWSSLDSGVQKDLVKIGLLQNRATSADLLILDINDRIDLKIHSFTVRSLTNEYGFLWQKSKQELTPFDTVVSRTFSLNSKMLKYFFDLKTTSHINIISHIGAILLLFSFFSWIYSSRRKLTRLKDDHLNTLSQTNYVVRNPFCSSLIIAAMLALYFYDQPPFIFLELLLLIVMACTGVLIKPVWPKTLFNFWGALFVLTILYALTNLFILTSYADRISLLILSAAAVAIGLVFLNNAKIAEKKYPPYTRLTVILFAVFHSAAFVLNLIGRFSLAKIIGVATVFNLCLGFGFYLLIQVIMEGLFLQLESNKSAKKSFSSYVDFNILQNKFKSALIKIAIVLWFVKLFENLYIDDYIYGIAGDFLTHPYKFGTTALTFGSLVIFIFVIWVSIIISRVISYFYDYAGQQSTAANDVKKTRTSILLIRLSVFSVGFIAAITLSGIPLSEVTIVIGALGVGIGFGLQNIVNNLVSGVILAFEKPVQVGDIIEVGNRSGVIKEIGIRATKIEAGNGSELIVPNGDLISQHLVNWTLTNNNRQIELVVGVAYGSDVAKVDAILKRILKNRTDIMQTPSPAVFLHNFSDSSVDFRLLFWAADIHNWVSLKSNVMIEVYTTFAKEGIEIPHPKRDIQVFFPEGTNAEIKTQDALKEILPNKAPLTT